MTHWLKARVGTDFMNVELTLFVHERPFPVTQQWKNIGPHSMWLAAPPQKPYPLIRLQPWPSALWASHCGLWECPDHRDFALEMTHLKISQCRHIHRSTNIKNYIVYKTRVPTAVLSELYWYILTLESPLFGDLNCPEKVFQVGTVHYNWPMSAHASQAFSTVHCTDSKDFPCPEIY